MLLWLLLRPWLMLLPWPMLLLCPLLVPWLFLLLRSVLLLWLMCYRDIAGVVTSATALAVAAALVDAAWQVLLQWLVPGLFLLPRQCCCCG